MTAVSKGILDDIRNIIQNTVPINGTSGSDVFSLPANLSSATYDGLGGTDTAVFSGKMSQFSISQKTNAEYVVKPQANKDVQVTLLNTEILKFGDYQITTAAFDSVTKKDFQIIRASLGANFLNDANIVNIGATLLASGLSVLDINNLLVTQNLMSAFVNGGRSDNLSVFNHTFTNVMGRVATASESGYWMPLIQQNGQAWFLTEMAAQPSNTPATELIGFQQKDFTLTL